MAHLIFDFDGTLADTLPLVMDVSARIVGKPPLEPEALAPLRRLPLLQAVRTLHASRWRVLQMALMTRPAMQSRMTEVSLFDGVAEMVRNLHEKGHTLHILSSNLERNVRVLLEKYGLLEYFGVIRHCNVFYKAYALRRLLARQGITPSDGIYIGNEPLDVRAAHKVGIAAIAVTWSGANEQLLKAERPEHIITSPRDITALFPQKTV